MASVRNRRPDPVHRRAVSSDPAVKQGRVPRPAQSPARPLEPLLTIAQTAELLQVSDKTIRRHIAQGSLIAHRIGAQWRLAPRDVADYLRDTRVR